MNNQVHTYVPHTIIRKKVNSYSKQVLKINQVILSQSELNFMKSFKCGKAKTLSWHCGLKIEKCWLNKNTANFSNSSRHKIEKCWLDENTESLSHSSSQEIGKIFQVINRNRLSERNALKPYNFTTFLNSDTTTTQLTQKWSWKWTDLLGCRAIKWLVKKVHNIILYLPTFTIKHTAWNRHSVLGRRAMAAL